MAHDLKMLTRRWFEEVWNKGNEKAIDEMTAPVIASHGLSKAPMRDGDHFRVFYKMYRTAFPDIQATVDDCIQEGDKTACRVTFRAHHRGDTLGFPATGREVTFGAVILITWREGKIVEAHNQFDQLGILRQLGQEARSVTVE